MPSVVESLAIAAWRRRMGIEPTARFGRATDFEDQGDHQTPIASVADTDDMGCAQLALEAANRVFRGAKLECDSASRRVGWSSTTPFCARAACNPMVRCGPGQADRHGNAARRRHAWLGEGALEPITLTQSNGELR